eukprot:g3381.t1
MVLAEVAGSTALWAVLAGACGKIGALRDPRGDDHAASCLFSLTVIAGILLLDDVVSYAVYDGQGIGAPNSAGQANGLAWCLGWFIVDTINDFRVNSRRKGVFSDPAMLAHHAFCIVVFGTPLLVGIGGAEICMFAFIAEISNPWFQLSLAFKGTRAELPMQLAFAGTFVPARTYWGTRLAAHTLSSSTHVVVKVCVAAVMSISYWWAVLIVRKSLIKAGLLASKTKGKAT